MTYSFYEDSSSDFDAYGREFAELFDADDSDEDSFDELDPKNHPSLSPAQRNSGPYR